MEGNPPIGSFQVQEEFVVSNHNIEGEHDEHLAISSSLQNDKNQEDDQQLVVQEDDYEVLILNQNENIIEGNLDSNIQVSSESVPLTYAASTEDIHHDHNLAKSPSASTSKFGPMQLEFDNQHFGSSSNCNYLLSINGKLYQLSGNQLMQIASTSVVHQQQDDNINKDIIFSPIANAKEHTSITIENQNQTIIHSNFGISNDHLSLPLPLVEQSNQLVTANSSSNLEHLFSEQQSQQQNEQYSLSSINVEANSISNTSTTNSFEHMTIQNIQEHEQISCHLNLTQEQNSNPSTTLNVNIPVLNGQNYSLQINKFIFPSPLCRVCLLSKENMISLYEGSIIDSKGKLINARGPNSNNRFNVLPLLRSLFDIDINYGDGLGDKICVQCIDAIFTFSIFRKRISIGQTKLNEIIRTVNGTSNPTIIPQIGEIDMKNTSIFKHTSLIIRAQDILKTSKYSHFVIRNLSDRAWEKIFVSLSEIVGHDSKSKSTKMKSLEKFILDEPYVTGWFCQKCQITIHGSRKNYVQHSVQIHDIKSEEVLYSCDICSSSFPFINFDTSQSYCYHWIEHFFFFECEICSKNLPSLKGLNGHKRMHLTPNTDKSYQCDLCTKVFLKKSYLESHKQTHLNSEERKKFLIYCTICGKGLKSSLIAHINSVHSNERKYKCEMYKCDKTFKRKEILNGHMSAVHFNLKKFQCKLCFLFFKSYSTFRLHKLKHEGENGKSHECNVCQKRFFSNHSLKSHLLKHKAIGEIQCPHPQCSKTFKRKSYLKEHVKIHSGEKPFICQFCGKCIKMKSNFFKHLKVHKRREEMAAAVNAAKATKEKVGENISNKTIVTTIDGHTLEVIFETETTAGDEEIILK